MKCPMHPDILPHLPLFNCFFHAILHTLQYFGGMTGIVKSGTSHVYLRKHQAVMPKYMKIAI